MCVIWVFVKSMQNENPNKTEFTVIEIETGCFFFRGKQELKARMVDMDKWKKGYGMGNTGTDKQAA